jgi:hypothetical protein
MGIVSLLNDSVKDKRHGLSGFKRNSPSKRSFKGRVARLGFTASKIGEQSLPDKFIARSAHCIPAASLTGTARGVILIQYAHEQSFFTIAPIILE